MSTTRELADRLTAIPNELPERTVEAATVLILDAVGAGLYGASTDVSQAVRRAVPGFTQDGRVPVWGHDLRLEASAAALVNGTQAHACELDDYYAGGKCHPGAVVVPAVLAAAEQRGATGAEVVRAVVGGYEAMVRASLAAGANGTRRRGWHLTGLVGPFGAATGAALLEGADRDLLLHALGIAGSYAGGLFAFSSSGAMTKRLHAGKAAQAGLQALAYAKAGVTGPPDVLEAADGGFIHAVSDDADAGRLLAGFGDPYVVEGTSIKPYSCCGSLHSSIDAVIELAEEHDLAAEEISAIVAHNASVVDQQCGFVYRGTGGLLEAQMSLQYCLAVAAVDRAAFLPQFTSERIGQDDVQTLAQRVSFELDDAIEAEYPRTMPARVTITTTDGRTLEHTVAGPTGSPARPFDLAAAQAKFEGLVAGVLPDDAMATLVERLRGIAALDDVRTITELLAVGEPARL